MPYQPPPPKAISPLIPFWFWNERLSKDEIVTQIEEMNRKGIHAFFMHARFGLETPYLSEEWFDYIRLAVETAHRLNLKAWIYDDFPFPSGFGGLKVTENLDYRGKFLDWQEHAVSGPGEIYLP